MKNGPGFSQQAAQPLLTPFQRWTGRFPFRLGFDDFLFVVKALVFLGSAISHP